MDRRPCKFKLYHSDEWFYGNIVGSVIIRKPVKQPKNSYFQSNIHLATAVLLQGYEYKDVFHYVVRYYEQGQEKTICIPGIELVQIKEDCQ